MFLCEAKLAIHVRPLASNSFFLFKGAGGTDLLLPVALVDCSLAVCARVAATFCTCMGTRCVYPVLLVQWRRLTLARKSANHLCYWRVNGGVFIQIFLFNLLFL